MPTPSHWTQIDGPLETKVRLGQATKIARLFGFDFFENPTKGDEAPILARDSAGRVFNTNDFDLPEYL